LCELDLVVEHGVDRLEVFGALIVQFGGLLLEFGEAALGVDVDGIFGDVAYVEPLLELLRSLWMC